MAITKLPKELKSIPMNCAICFVILTLDKATAGPLDCTGRQAFACVSHFSEIEKLINGWADFSASERFKALHDGQSPTDLIRGQGHVRFDS